MRFITLFTLLLFHPNTRFTATRLILQLRR